MESMKRWWQRRKQISEERRAALKLQIAEYDAQQAYDKIKKFIDSFETLQQWEQRYQVSRYYIAAALLVIGSYVFIRVIGGGTFVNVVGLLYPGYQSYKTIESSVDELEYIQWLMYWVVFGVFHLCELFLSAFIRWGAMYHCVKLAFLIFCFAPETRGATLAYQYVVRPLLHRHQDKIDNHLDQIRKVSGQAADEIGQLSSTFLGNAASNMAKSFVTTLASPKEIEQ